MAGAARPALRDRAVSGPIESKVTASTLASLLGPLVATFLALLIAFGVPLTDAQVYAVGAFVAAALPVAVFYAGWRAQHTRRPDLDKPAP